MTEFTQQGVNIISTELTDNSFPTTAQDLSQNNFYRTAGGYNVFEFYAMDISQTFSVAPSFIPIIKGDRFGDVSAVAIMHADAINFSRLFKFKSDDTIVPSDWSESNVSFNNMYFGCEDIGAFNNSILRYSNASVTVNLANKADIYVNDTTIKQDYVRHLAKSITGGYAMSEIFVNEKELIEGVENMDAHFNTSMRDIIINASNGGSQDERYNGLYTGTFIEGNPVALSCQNLVANLFALNVSVIGEQSNGDAASWARGQQFLTDLSNQTTADISDNEFYVKFRNKDVLALRLTYAPFGSVDGLDSADNTNANSAPGTNPVYSRSYKVYIVMDDAENYEEGYAVEPNPRPWSHTV
jgi:hypothetical protein